MSLSPQGEWIQVLTGGLLFLQHWRYLKLLSAAVCWFLQGHLLDKTQGNISDTPQWGRSWLYHQSNWPIGLPRFCWESETRALCSLSHSFPRVGSWRGPVEGPVQPGWKGRAGLLYPSSMRGEGVGLIHSKPTPLSKNVHFLISNFHPCVLLSRVKYLGAVKLIFCRLSPPPTHLKKKNSVWWSGVHFGIWYFYCVQS